MARLILDHYKLKYESIETTGKYCKNAIDSVINDNAFKIKNYFIGIGHNVNFEYDYYNTKKKIICIYELVEVYGIKRIDKLRTNILNFYCKDPRCINIMEESQNKFALHIPILLKKKNILYLLICD